MKKVCYLLIVFTISVVLSGQSISDGRFGVHIQFYGEPHEEGNPLYVNIVPLVYEMPFLNKVNIKSGLIFSLRISETIDIGNIGVVLGTPYYIIGEGSNGEGLFAGPIILSSYNLYTKEIVISSGLDIGYNFPVSQSMNISLGGELGVSTFFFQGETNFRPHLGPAIYLYF